MGVEGSMSSSNDLPLGPARRRRSSGCRRCCIVSEEGPEAHRRGHNVVAVADMALSLLFVVGGF